MTDTTDDAVDPRFRAIAERGKALLDDPDYRRNAAELRAATEAAELLDRQRRRRAALERAGVPEATWPLLDAPGRWWGIRAARAFLFGSRRVFLILSGPTLPRGVGKTVTCAWAVAKVGGRYVTAAELVRISQFDRETWDLLAAVRLLAIDELAAEHANTAFESVLYELLDARFRASRKTILATNLAGPEFRARYCGDGLERLYRRLKEHGKLIVLPPHRRHAPANVVPFPGGRP